MGNPLYRQASNPHIESNKLIHHHPTDCKRFRILVSSAWNVKKLGIPSKLSISDYTEITGCILLNYRHKFYIFCYSAWQAFSANKSGHIEAQARHLSWRRVQKIITNLTLGSIVRQRLMPPKAHLISSKVTRELPRSLNRYSRVSRLARRNIKQRNILPQNFANPLAQSQGSSMPRRIWDYKVTKTCK